MKREWGAENFLSLARLIIKHTNYNILLAGGKSDIQHEKFFLDQLPNDRVVSQIGKTTLPELAVLIAQSFCAISNDTSYN